MALGTPTLTAETDPEGFVTLVLACTGATRGSIRRLTPTGSRTVRSADDIDMTSGAFITADYEIPQSTELRYYGEVTDGATTKTTPVLTITGLDRGTDWISAFGSPLSGIAINVEKIDGIRQEAKSDVAKVLNRPDPVVVNWGRDLGATTINFITLTDDERIAFSSLLSSGRTLIFQPRIGYGFEEPLFLAVGNVTETRPSTAGGEPARIWECEVTLTGPPPPQFSVPIGFTWQDKVLDGADWQFYVTQGQTWLEFAGVA